MFLGCNEDSAAVDTGEECRLPKELSGASGGLAYNRRK